MGLALPPSDQYHPMLHTGNIQKPNYHTENQHVLDENSVLIPIKQDVKSHNVYHNSDTQDIYQSNLDNVGAVPIPQPNLYNSNLDLSGGEMSAYNSYNPVKNQQGNAIMMNQNANNQMLLNLANAIKAAQFLKMMREEKKKVKTQKKKGKKSDNLKKSDKKKEKKKGKSNKKEAKNSKKNNKNNKEFLRFIVKKEKNITDSEKLFNYFTNYNHDFFQGNEHELEKTLQKSIENYLNNPTLVKYAQNVMSKYMNRPEGQSYQMPNNPIPTNGPSHYDQEQNIRENNIYEHQGYNQEEMDNHGNNFFPIQQKKNDPKTSSNTPPTNPSQTTPTTTKTTSNTESIPNNNPTKSSGSTPSTTKTTTNTNNIPVQNPSKPVIVGNEKASTSPKPSTTTNKEDSKVIPSKTESSKSDSNSKKTSTNSNSESNNKNSKGTMNNKIDNDSTTKTKENSSNSPTNKEASKSQNKESSENSKSLNNKESSQKSLEIDKLNKSKVQSQNTSKESSVQLATTMSTKKADSEDQVKQESKQEITSQNSQPIKGKRSLTTIQEVSTNSGNEVDDADCECEKGPNDPSKTPGSKDPTKPPGPNGNSKKCQCECDNKKCGGHKCKGKYTCKFGNPIIRVIIKRFMKWVYSDCEGDDEEIRRRKIRKIIKFLKKYEKCEGGERIDDDTRKDSIKDLVKWYYKHNGKDKEKTESFRKELENFIKKLGKKETVVQKREEIKEKKEVEKQKKKQEKAKLVGAPIPVFKTKCKKKKCENLLKLYLKMYLKCKKYKKKKKDCKLRKRVKHPIGYPDLSVIIPKTINEYLKLHGIGIKDNENNRGSTNVVLTNSADLLHQKPKISIHISALKDFFDQFIQGFKMVEARAVRIIKDGKIYSLQENFNAYITCTRLNEGISGKYVDELRYSIKNININDFSNSLKTVFHALQGIVLAIGERCVGIDHMLDYVYEYLVKSCNSIQFTFDFEKLKRKGFKQLDKHVYDQAGKTLGFIFGQLRKVRSSFDK